MSTSGGIDYVSSANFDFFAAEATPSGSGHPPPVYELYSESPLDPPPTENQTGAAHSSSYAIPATVILVTIGALLLLAGGLKLCAFIRQKRKRQSYMYATDTLHVRVDQTSSLNSAMPLKLNNNYTLLQQQSGYNACRCPRDWSTLPTTDLSDLDSPNTRPQPRFRELVRMADALDGLQAQGERSNRERNGEGEGEGDTETTSLSSSVGGNGECAKTTVVEVELHLQD